MTETDKLYYGEMLKRGRLIPFFVRDELICFISFYITNNPDNFIGRKNPWIILEDEPDTGRICYVDQIWSDKKEGNHKYSREVWSRFINFIKLNYPLVENLKWNRYKNGELFKFNITIKKE